MKIRLVQSDSDCHHTLFTHTGMATIGKANIDGFLHTDLTLFAKTVHFNVLNILNIILFPTYRTLDLYSRLDLYTLTLGLVYTTDGTIMALCSVKLLV